MTPPFSASGPSAAMSVLGGPALTWLTDPAAAKMLAAQFHLCLPEIGNFELRYPDTRSRW